MKTLKQILEASDKIEISLTNEGQDFYVDTVSVTEKGPKSILNIEKKLANVVKMLNKELPGGTWDYTIGN